MIVGQNALLNQYVPTFFIKNIVDGQTLVYDSVRKAFVNSNATGGSGATKLGELLNVSPTVDSPNPTLANGQGLVYNALTSLWENTFVDYNTLLNKPVIPTNSSFSFAALSDTAKPSLPDGYVKWNSTGTQLVYSTTIPAASITGLATVAFTGNYNDLTNKPATGGSVTSVSVTSANGVSGVVANPTTTPAITLTLGAITPTSVAATGTVTGSNLSGTNTGDQTITLTGDVSGSGTSSFPTTLATVNSTTGTFGSSTQVPVFTVDAKGRITNVSNVNISAGGTGTVTSINVSGGTTGLTTIGGPITTSGTITLGGTLAVANGGTGATTAAGALTNLLPSQTGNSGKVLTTNGSVTSWTTSNTGTVTSIAATGNNGISVSGSPITTSGTLTFGLGNITPTSVAATGTISGSNFSGSSSGTNTGDQTITLTGDVTGSGTGSFATTLATVNSAPQTDTFRKITVNAKGLVTATSAVTSTDITTALGFTPYNSTNPAGYTSNTGTVTSVSATGSSDITVGGSPITSSGTLTFALSNTTVVANTYGSATQIPVFTVDAKGRITGVTNTNISVSSGTVTSVNASGGTTGLTFSGGPITSSGTLTLAGTLAIANGGTGATTQAGAANAILPSQTGNSGKVLTTNGTNVSWTTAATGTVTSVGITTTSSRITTSGSPITSSGNIALDLATTAVTAGSYTNANITVDAYGRITSASNGSSGGTGTVTSVAASGSQGVTVSGSPITTSGTITVGLGNITPTSVAATGTVTGSNLSGTNTGDQTITLTGDVTGSGTGTFTTALATVNTSPGTYADAHFVPTITVNGKGLVTSVTTQHVDTSVRDLVPDAETITVDQRHQYIVTGTMEVLGRMVNNGRIAIL